MPTKKNTNKLSQIYKNIDQRELSEQAKDALSKLRMATGNFRKQEGKEADAFMLFYNRLVSKKPTAVKTTPEYKAMIKERQRENARKMLEAKKAKQESRQGQGSEKDAARPAKPFGWRLKGKHNYRKPTREEIRTGKAYYEARINRADTKRTKFPMLERGGYMEHGGIIAYANNDYENKIGTFSSMLDAKKFAKANKWRYETILFEDENGDNIIVSKDDTFKDVDSLFADSFKNGGEMAKGGDVEMLKGKYVNIFSMGVKNPISTDIIEAKMSDPTFRYQTLSLKTRGGGEERIEGKEKINDFLKGKMVFVRDSSEEYGIQLIDTFAKGGNVYSSDDAYEVIILKDGVEVDRVVLRAKNKGEARMMYEDYHEGKMMKNHGEDITYEIIVAPSKMANGGEVFYKESHKMGH